MSGQSEVLTAVGLLEQLQPKALPLVAALARRLGIRPEVAGLLAVGPDLTTEPAIAAAHGRAQLALAVATAAAVLHRTGIPPWAVDPPAVLGAAIGTAVLLLHETPMPEGYRWLRRSLLSDAATVTVVTGANVAEVLQAFGADPARPESMRAISSSLGYEFELCEAAESTRAGRTPDSRINHHKYHRPATLAHRMI